MVISRNPASEYRFYIYAGHVKTTATCMWLDIAKLFATYGTGEMFGTMHDANINDEGTLCMHFHTEDNSNLIEITYEDMVRLTTGEIIEVAVW